MKICPTCQCNKEESEFPWKNKMSQIRGGYCKPCQRAYAKKHYQLNRKSYLAKAKKNDAKLAERHHQIIIDYLNEHPCVDCGEQDIVVLDFDHRADKLFAISARLGRVSCHKLKLEISKCDIRCANCHRRKTAKDRGYYKTKVLLEGFEPPILEGTML